jgi:hypothetical protein
LHTVLWWQKQHPFTWTMQLQPSPQTGWSAQTVHPTPPPLTA